MVELRDYQRRAIAMLLENMDTGIRRQILSMPTGSGKTETAHGFIEAVRRAEPNKQAVVVVEREVLVTQTAARFARGGHLVGVVQGANTYVRGYEPVVVASVQTLRSRWGKELRRGMGITGEEFVRAAGVVVIDECHILHEQHATILGAVDRAVPVLGLTATPLRDGLGKYFEAIVTPTTIRELQDAGFLVRAKCYSPPRHDIEAALGEIGVRAGDYIESQLSQLMRQRAVIGDVVSAWRERAEGRRTIAFCVDRAHARDLFEEFAMAGVAVGYVDGETPDDERQELYRALREGRIRVLVSISVLSIGFDEPSVEVAVLARPTRSLALYIQQVGRVLRPHPGKGCALVLDHAANVLRFDVPEAFGAPSELDGTAPRWSRRTERDDRSVVVCAACQHVYSVELRKCPECGHIRIPQTAAVYIDGRLVEVDLDREPGRAAQGVSRERLRAEYLMMRWVCRANGWKDGAAYHRIVERHKLQHGAIPRDWSRSDPIPPDDDFARWFRGDQQRRIIAWRNRRDAA